jgi:hypothetical protein
MRWPSVRRLATHAINLLADVSSHTTAPRAEHCNGCKRATAAKKAMTIAADTCIYTNHNFTIESMASKPPPVEGEEAAPGTGGADVAGDAGAAAVAAEAEAAAERAAPPSMP